MIILKFDSVKMLSKVYLTKMKKRFHRLQW